MIRTISFLPCQTLIFSTASSAQLDTSPWFQKEYKGSGFLVRLPVNREYWLRPLFIRKMKNKIVWFGLLKSVKIDSVVKFSYTAL